MHGQLTTYAQHVCLLGTCVQGIAETSGGVSGNWAVVSMVTKSVHCWGEFEHCGMSDDGMLIACAQPIYGLYTHMCGCTADDMRSVQQRTKPWVWHETGSPSRMAFTFFLQLNFLVCCCNVSGFVLLLFRLAGIPLLTVSLANFMTNCFLCFYIE